MTTRPTTYEIRVDGHLDDYWGAWFERLTIHRLDDGTSRLVAHVADQAQLHGLLARLRDLNLAILTLAAQPPDPGADPDQGR